MNKPAYRRALLALVLALGCVGAAGCDMLADTVLDGVLDYIESTTANLLEEAFPIASQGQEG